jgi:hypothetical protein
VDGWTVDPVKQLTVALVAGALAFAFVRADAQNRVGCHIRLPPGGFSMQRVKLYRYR